MKKILCFITVMMIASGAHASEQWECKDSSAWSWDIVAATASAATKARSAEVTIRNKTYSTSYEIDGYKRRWNWGYIEGEGYRYSFVLRVDDSAALYDFGSSGSGKVAPEVRFQCRQIRK